MKNDSGHGQLAGEHLLAYQRLVQRYNATVNLPTASLALIVQPA